MLCRLADSDRQCTLMASRRFCSACVCASRRRSLYMMALRVAVSLSSSSAHMFYYINIYYKFFIAVCSVHCTYGNRTLLTEGKCIINHNSIINCILLVQCLVTHTYWSLTHIGHSHILVTHTYCLPLA